MGWLFNRLKSESVYEALKLTVPAMNVLGYPESSQICDDFKPCEENECSKTYCSFAMKVKYQGKWDIEFGFYYYQKDKEIGAFVRFRNLSLDGKWNGASDELRESISKQFYSKWDWEQFTFDFRGRGTTIYLAKRKIKEVADVGKYVFNFQESWNSKKIIDVLTQFQTDEECLNAYDLEPVNESVEIDGLSSIDDIYND